MTNRDGINMETLIYCFDAAYDYLGWFTMFLLIEVSLFCTCLCVVYYMFRGEFNRFIYETWELFVGAGDLFMRRVFYDKSCDYKSGW